ncbi:MAG: hypothetical protein Q8R00_03365 [Candidatus Nanoarchaeia archaeon]|nr:hypothetical protein [Candidatus Nanoarchaeia archaeon]
MEKTNDKKQSKFATGFKFVFAGVVLLVLLLVMGFLVGQITGAAVFGSNNEYELKGNDIFANLKDFNNMRVSILGIKLGDTSEVVLEKLGKPDIQQIHPPNVLNWEYGDKIETDGVGLIVHMEGGIVTSLIVKKPFNKYLVGASKIEGVKEDIYRKYGKPDRLEIHYPFTYYYYDNEGFDVIADAGKINGYVIRL